MSDQRSLSRSDAAAVGRRAGEGLDGALQGVIRLVLGVVGVALATRLLHGQVSPFEAMLLGGVLAAAAAFGLVTGLLAAAIALLTYHLAGGASLQWPAPEGPLLLALISATVAAVGLCADVAAGQRRRQSRPMIEAIRPLAPASSPSRTKRFLGLTRKPVAAPGHGPARAGAGLGMVVGASIALLLNWALPAVHGSSIGVREAVELALLGAAGWGIGALADGLRRERAARQALIGAVSELSTCADEAAVRRILLESLLRVDPAGAFEILDDVGGALTSRTGEPARQRGTDSPGWRARRLKADGRDVGEVRWRFPGAKSSARASDEIAGSLIDLAASAIMRVRLAAEKADMEYITRAEHLRTILLDAVSHHFRTPLAGILGSVTSILNLPEPHDHAVHRDFLLIIKEQANRLNRYVDNFLSLARLEVGAIEVNLADVNVEMLIYDVWDSFGAIGGARRYFQVELDTEMVRSDAALLAQVFGNILENAIKYSPVESLVEVRSRRDGDRLTIEVLDQGAGVPEASLPRMFDRFYRSHAAKAPGLGLGLYITRSLVEILGGALSAQNRSDGRTGLMVSVSLPLGRAGS